MISLRALAGLGAAPQRADSAGRCEICARALYGDHAHVVEIGVRGVLCACAECGILFTRADSTARYRTVPSRVRRDPAFSMTPTRWAALGVPVGLAFCVRDSKSARVVVRYPGPAGIVDAELTDAAWDEFARASRFAAELSEDVEALLVYGARGATRMSCYLVPITVAYELVARLRRHWEGFTGGETAEQALAAFFHELDERGGHS
jgi:hypothetical protein